MSIQPRKLIVIGIIAAFVVGAIIVLMRGDRSRDLVLMIEPFDPSDEVTVYVGGAVSEPGLFSLPRGARLSEALDLAGPLDSSDTSALDLASTLRDEQTIMVPEQQVAGPDTERSEVSDQVADSRVDINTATEEQLLQLPGIGPALSARIVEYRESQGPFDSLDELSQISGISDRMVDEIRDLAIAGR